MTLLPLTLQDLKKYLLLGEAPVIYARASSDMPLEPFKLGEEGKFLFWDTNDEEWCKCGDPETLLTHYTRFYQLLEEKV